ncbi:MAG: hypothetical protein A3J48_02895 [Candidatus Doudnabacteria bacterium RIFCSPHIGHO2_02_FULL_46_11]|uniref:Uncharacterized protein n=1 Tax=Candidatus Doudnabacteria bacterium RIFCSPHIGHO2_02_FULL_46_11 TaxID=1817832 RepID=A0A1F5P572_9BACT|nr:MAG: hypothetical protein A3J48_02895 [Candidatus Doudnabacteria bacterium RIFCSPHIGHO2_02_FULL_46_11]
MNASWESSLPEDVRVAHELRVKIHETLFRGQLQFEGRWQKYKVVLDLRRGRYDHWDYPKDGEEWYVHPLRAVGTILFCKPHRIHRTAAGEYPEAQYIRDRYIGGEVTVLLDRRTWYGEDNVLSVVETIEAGLRLIFRDGRDLVIRDDDRVHWKHGVYGRHVGEGGITLDLRRREVQIAFYPPQTCVVCKEVIRDPEEGCIYCLPDNDVDDFDPEVPFWWAEEY